jgi:NADH:ubiquinone oxidoreductase subunit 4 (subunit M)
MTIVMGIVPNAFLKPIEPSVRKVVERIREAAPTEIQARVKVKGEIKN